MSASTLRILIALFLIITLKNTPRLCRISMGIFIAIQVLSFPWSFFSMDTTGAEATFAGTMHNVLGGIVALATILILLLMGIGLRQTDGNKNMSLSRLFYPR